MSNKPCKYSLARRIGYYKLYKDLPGYFTRRSIFKRYIRLLHHGRPTRDPIARWLKFRRYKNETTV